MVEPGTLNSAVSAGSNPVKGTKYINERISNMSPKNLIATGLYLIGLGLYIMGFETWFALPWVIAILIHWKFWLVILGGFLIGMKLSEK